MKLDGADPKWTLLIPRYKINNKTPSNEIISNYSLINYSITLFIFSRLKLNYFILLINVKYY